MTDEEIAAIRARAHREWDHDYFDGDVLAELYIAVAERDRLRTENAAMREIVEAVAKSNPYGSWLPATNTPPGVVCRWCMERAQTPAQCQHDVECTWTQTRALLAQTAPSPNAEPEPQ